MFMVVRLIYLHFTTFVYVCNCDMRYQLVISWVSISIYLCMYGYPTVPLGLGCMYNLASIVVYVPPMSRINSIVAYQFISASFWWHGDGLVYLD